MLPPPGADTTVVRGVTCLLAVVVPEVLVTTAGVDRFADAGRVALVADPNVDPEPVAAADGPEVTAAPTAVEED